MKIVKVKLEEIKKVFSLVRVLRKKLKECKEIKKFYEDEINEYNKRFSKR